MKNRLISLPKQQSYFIFGARGTGKSTLIKQAYQCIDHLFINLLENKTERELFRTPDLLKAWVLALPQTTKYVIIDEIQKIPELLDIVHDLLESTDKVFIMTGSSARKLKYGAANLLAGRAFVRYLYPFSFLELLEEFDLNQALSFGMLPKVYEYHDNLEKAEFLRAYAHVYLKEEIWAEQLVRQLTPFHYFLEVAAQCNGKVININQIAREVGVNDKTITSYFSILEDTLIGFYLPAFHRSFRKRMIQKPKFYFFDTGVVRALSQLVSVPIQERSYEYGNAFEHFIILECTKLASYYFPDFRFSHLRTHDDREVDLVVERPGQPLLLIEIKSAESIRTEQIKHLASIAKEFKSCEPVCFARIPRAMKLGDVLVLPWQEGIKQYFAIK